MTTENPSTIDTSSSLCTPWSLDFDRDGTEDYGIIRDADGDQIVASHLTGVQDPFEHAGTFWLPESDDDPMPAAVRKMQLMTTAPKLLDLLKVAVATADPSTHRWVQEAFVVIAEATGQEYDAKQAEAVRHLHRAAPRLFASLEAACALLRDYRTIAEALACLLSGDAESRWHRAMDVCHEAHQAVAAAKGEIAF